MTESATTRESEEPGATGGARRRQRKHAAILEAAARLIRDEGFEGLTIQALAAALDLTPGALYRYFASKDEILAALEAEALIHLDENFVAALARFEAAPHRLSRRAAALAPLLVAARYYLSATAASSEYTGLLRRMLGDPTPLVDGARAQPAMEAFRALMGRLGGHLEAAAAAGALERGPMVDRALAYWSALHGVSQLDKLRRFDAHTFDTLRLGLETARALLRGWGARAADLAAALNAVGGEP